MLQDRLLGTSEIQQLYADPWAMGRLRRKVYAAVVLASQIGLRA